MAAAMALLASTTGINASISQQNTVPPVATAKRQNEDEHTPALVLTPPSDSGILIAGHSSHSSHSSHTSHYSSSGGGNYAPAPPAYTPPAAPATPTVPPPPAYTPPVSSQPSVLPPPRTLLSTSILNKLTLLPALWPQQVALTQRFIFTKISNGIATGTIEAPPGTLVDLISVKGPKLIVSYLGNKAEIDAAITDIGNRVDANIILSTPLPTPR